MFARDLPHIRPRLYLVDGCVAPDGAADGGVAVDGLGREEYMGGGSSSPSDSSSPPTPSDTPTPAVSQGGSLSAGHPSGHAIVSQALPLQLPPGLVLAPSVPGRSPVTVVTTATSPKTSTVLSGGSMVVGGSGGSVMYAASGGVVYAAPHTSLTDASTPVLLKLPHGLQVAHDQIINFIRSRTFTSIRSEVFSSILVFLRFYYSTTWSPSSEWFLLAVPVLPGLVHPCLRRVGGLVVFPVSMSVVGSLGRFVASVCVTVSSAVISSLASPWNSSHLGCAA
ncbi:hypothetical protein Hamer_G013377 [Homarus americanus]|uniref:Uncharacterized protein n=1 Tax=Homarus americanus TaxID=6706 RepID=A0A8J5K356_HOMAM|nr:hypothetical protein Hamer_G013377 [Homarus americanus]